MAIRLRRCIAAPSIRVRPRGGMPRSAAGCAQDYPSRHDHADRAVPAGRRQRHARAHRRRASSPQRSASRSWSTTAAAPTASSRCAPAARAAPDGYTLLFANSSTTSINPTLYANAGYDPRKDFAPIGLLASMGIGIIANPEFPAQTVAALIALASRDRAGSTSALRRPAAGRICRRNCSRRAPASRRRSCPTRARPRSPTTSSAATCRSRSACCRRRSATSRPASSACLR